MYADDSQYVVLADQLTLLTGHDHQPSIIHHEAIKWLEDKHNWDLLLNHTINNDMFDEWRCKFIKGLPFSFNWLPKIHIVDNS